MDIKITPNVTTNKIAKTEIKQNKQAPLPPAKADSFEKVSNENKILDAQLKSIILPERLNYFYNKMSQEMELDYQPKLNIINKPSFMSEEGYDFQKNEINLNINDLLTYDKKIVIEKNDTDEVLTDKKGLPLLVNDKMADQYISFNEDQPDNVKVKKVELDDDDKANYLLQKLYSDVVTAKQFMTMRKTPGTNEKDIFRAMNNFRPSGIVENLMCQVIVDKMYNESFWKNHKTDLSNPPSQRMTDVGRQYVKNLYNMPKDYLNSPLNIEAIEKSQQFANSLVGK